MWVDGQGWKWEEFGEYLPLNILKLIQSFELVDNTRDKLFWGASSNGMFSIKSAISLIRNDDIDSGDPYWNVVWAARVQNRVRFFLWLVLHERIMCNDNRFKRGLSDTNICSLCNNGMDSVMHTLRDCCYAMHLWDLVCPVVVWHDFYEDDNVQNWITSNIRNAEPWSIKFPITLWWIWKWRNEKVFRGNDSWPVDIEAFINDKVEETIKAMRRDLSDNMIQMERQEEFISWAPPPYDWVTLNTDGAARGAPGHAGAGGMLRDHRGVCITFFAKPLGICNAIKAELMALKQGLNMAAGMGVKHLEVRVDNKACSQILLSNAMDYGSNQQLVSQCKKLLLQSTWVVSIHHCYREANRVADWLANYGVQHEIASNAKLQDFHALARIVAEDVQGVAHPRLINKALVE